MVSGPAASRFFGGDPTDSTKADKGTIRGDYRVDMMVNVAHASDSPAPTEAEISRFLEPGEVFDR